jgi:hypothetical protein
MKKKPMGTCFIAAHFSRETGSHFAYLVTAKHVYKNLMGGDGQIFVRMNKLGDGVEYVPIPKTGWIPHTDPNVDLIIHPWYSALKAAGLADPQRHMPSVMTVAISMEEIASSSQAAAASLRKPWPPEEGEQVFFVGMMVQHQGTERNFPVVRTGRIALNTEELVDIGEGPSRYRLIECQSYWGNSGAPVWVYYGDDVYPCFLGVLSLGFPSEVEQIGPNVYRNSGISGVVPGEYLAEMLLPYVKETPATDRGEQS